MEPTVMSKTNLFFRILCVVYLLGVVWWLYMFLFNFEGTLSNYLYGLIYLGLVPLLGGINGLYLSKLWGMFRSAIGKAVSFLSLGLISWAIGTIVFVLYYNLYAQIEVPYPSLSDFFYIISWPLWGIGIFYLSRATGAKFGLMSSKGKSIFFLAPLVVIVLSYYLLVVVARGSQFDFSESSILKVFFDLAYPIGDLVILTFVTLVYSLSYNYFGGKYKSAIYLILIGFVFNYFSDFAFSYTTTLGTFYVAGWVDFLFGLTMFTLSVGVSMLNPKKLES